MARDTKDDVAGAKASSTPTKQPTVLMFQPTRFEVVEGDKLKEWEKHLREDVGLRGLTVGADFATAGGTASVSLCGRPERRDDCDQI